MDTKSLFVSKTFWFNVVGLVAAVGSAFGLDLGMDEETKAQVVGGIMAVGNIVLRLVTKEPVKV